MGRQLKVEITMDGEPHSSATITRDGTRHGIDVVYRSGDRKLSWKCQALGRDPDGVVAGVLLYRVGADVEAQAEKGDTSQ